MSETSKGGECMNGTEKDRVRVILDTDANNEIDDQHAIAYLLFSGDVFDVEGITSNRTSGGGPVDKHTEEAQRVVDLCDCASLIRVRSGADKSYAEIGDSVFCSSFDGSEAVDLIIERAHSRDARPLHVVAIGKLTNVALALKKDPAIASKIRVVWLGTGPSDTSGGYNFHNDRECVNPVIESGVAFDICPEDFANGTGAVKASRAEMIKFMRGLGPRISGTIPGRAGGAFSCFGDYSADLFERVDEEERSLYDVCALAILREPSWATPVQVSGYRVAGEAWEKSPKPGVFTVWKDFDREQILADFTFRCEQYALPVGCGQPA